MTTIVFDGDTFYSDTQATCMTNGKWTGAFLTDKIYSEGDDVWAAAGSKYIADLYNDRAERWMIKYFGWTFQWNCNMSQIDAFSGVSNKTEIIHANKKYVYVLTARARKVSLKLFKFRGNVLFVSVSKDVSRRSDIKWIVVGSGQDIVERHMNAGHAPDVAIRLTAMEDMYTNSLIKTVKCK
jgi:hypothetical protein